MENQNDLIRQCELKAQQWLDSPVYDDVTKKAVREMLDNGAFTRVSAAE